MLPVAIMATAMFISYQRAKAESLGYDAKGGLMERAERFIVLAFGLLFSEILIPVLWVMLALSLFTAGQRFVKVWRQATSDRQVPVRPGLDRRRARSARRSDRRQRHGSWRPSSRA
jgi:CDP-diacylglycerol--glycerol-3-phosphate 3-phosphatidyltransferase